MAEYVKIYLFQVPFHDIDEVELFSYLENDASKPYKTGRFEIERTKYNGTPVFTYKETYSDYSEEEFTMNRATYPELTVRYSKAGGSIKEWKLQPHSHYQEYLRQYVHNSTIVGMYIMKVVFDDYNSWDSYELPEYYQTLHPRVITNSYQSVLGRFAYDIPSVEEYYTKEQVDQLFSDLRVAVLIDWDEESGESGESGNFK